MSQTTTESNKVKGLQSTNKVLVTKTRTAKVNQEANEKKIAVLQEQLNKYAEIIEKLNKEIGKPKATKKKATKKSETFYNIYKGVAKKYKNGIKAIENSLKVNFPKASPSEIQVMINEIKTNGQATFKNRTYLTEKEFNKISK